MKKALFILPATMLFIASCDTSGSSDTLTGEYENGNGDKEHFDEDVMSFADGEATTGEDYFFGVLAEVVEVDIKLREIQELDEIDAELAIFDETMDECLTLIDDARDAMDLYTSENWPLRSEFHEITMDWFDAVEGLVVNYLQDLADPMSRPDETWTDEDLDLYEKYSEAYQDYLDIDGEWVEYQFTFADANGFELSETETIDIESMVEDEVSEKVD